MKKTRNPRCRMCGTALKQEYTFKTETNSNGFRFKVKGDPTGKYGLWGEGIFCTKTCAALYGSRVAKGENPK